MHLRQLVCLLVAATPIAACGSVKDKPPDLDATVDGPVDAFEDPNRIVHVSTTGNDANDGIAMPVKTLKRALGIAAANAAITKIALEPGRYDATTGETFPYTITTNLTIAGPAGGGAILVGTGAEPGLTLDRGRLQDLELESFSVAVTIRGTTTAANVRIRTSAIGVRGESGAVLDANQLDISGVGGGCQLGIELRNNAQLTAAMLATRSLGSALRAIDQSTATFTSMNVTGDPACNTPVFNIATSGTLAVTGGLIDGGTNGMNFFGAAQPTHATLTNTTIRNISGSPGDAITGRTVVFTMTGGELSNNVRAGIEASGGSWTLTSVALKQNPIMGIYLQGSGAAAPGILKMRGCTITNNGNGLYLFDNAQADLGSVAEPGTNTFQANTQVGVNIDGNSGARLIDAVGNTWRPNVQGANTTGKYPVVNTIAGPVDGVAGDNFSINAGWSLRR